MTNQQKWNELIDILKYVNNLDKNIIYSEDYLMNITERI